MESLPRSVETIIAAKEGWGCWIWCLKSTYGCDGRVATYFWPFAVHLLFWKWGLWFFTFIYFYFVLVVHTGKNTPFLGYQSIAWHPAHNFPSRWVQAHSVHMSFQWLCFLLTRVLFWFLSCLRTCYVIDSFLMSQLFSWPPLIMLYIYSPLCLCGELFFISVFSSDLYQAFDLCS